MDNRNNNEKPMGERMATLEAHMSDQDAKLVQISADIKEVKIILQKQDGYDARLARLENSSNLWKIINPILYVVVTSLIVLLVTFYIQHPK